MLNTFSSLISRIPLKRLLLYFMIVTFLPFGFIAMRYWKKSQAWHQVEERLLAVNALAETRERKQYLNTLVRNAYAEGDQLYLESQVESLSFLKKEKEALETLMHGPTFTGNEAAEKRYAFLTSEANHLEFYQGNVLSGEGVEEVLYTQAHPVEIDTHDLKELLGRLEGGRKGKPQLLITDFKMVKKAQRSGNEVFELTTKLIKREFR